MNSDQNNNNNNNQVNSQQESVSQQSINQSNMVLNNNSTSQNMNWQQPEFLQPSQPENLSNYMNAPINDGINNPNSNNKSSNKKSLIICIIVALVIILSGIGIGVFINKSKTNDVSNVGNGNDKNSSLDDSGIKQIEVTYSDIFALTNDENLYYIGGDTYGLALTLYEDNESHNTVKKLDSNVEKFYVSTMEAAIYYINKNKDLYYIGASYNAGASYQPEKDYSEVKDILVIANFCGLIINNNDEFLVKNNGFTKNSCGLNKNYDDFTKIADNVKSVFAYFDYSGYINNNDELYLSIADSIFKKIFDNVKMAVPYKYCNDKLLFLTNDNKLYIYDYGVDDVENDGLTLLKNDVSELTETYFKTTNGEYNVFSNYEDMSMIKNEAQLLYDSKEYGQDLYSGILDITDIKELIYYNLGNKLIYISNNNKLVLLEENNKEEISYNINNLKKIFEFVTKKYEEN